MTKYAPRENDVRCHPVLKPTYLKHVKKWKHCTKCSAYKTAFNRVFCRGYLPADVLVIADMPDFQDDAVGSPLLGQGGRLADRIVHECFVQYGDPLKPVRPLFVHSVACKPFTGPKKPRLPPKEALKTCLPRVAEVVALAQPIFTIVAGESDYVIRHVLQPMRCPYVKVMDFSAALRQKHPEVAVASMKLDIESQIAFCDEQVHQRLSLLTQGKAYADHTKKQDRRESWKRRDPKQWLEDLQFFRDQDEDSQDP